MLEHENCTDVSSFSFRSGKFPYARILLPAREGAGVKIFENTAVNFLALQSIEYAWVGNKVFKVNRKGRLVSGGLSLIIPSSILAGCNGKHVNSLTLFVL